MGIDEKGFVLVGTQREELAEEAESGTLLLEIAKQFGEPIPDHAMVLNYLLS